MTPPPLTDTNVETLQVCFYFRDEKCDYKKYGDDMAMRLCNTYWHSQDILHKYGAENIVLGMTSQVAEREDHVIVSDLRGEIFIYI